MSLAEGVRIGPYRIVDLLAVGGMGEVYRALDTRDRQPVALKTLPSELHGMAEARRRFEWEVHAAASIEGPHLCAVLDAGEVGGALYLVMELLQGRTVKELLHDGPCSELEVLQVGIGVARALQAVHTAGIVHRDVKPSNIIVTSRGAKLFDFGVATVMGGGAGRGTSTGRIELGLKPTTGWGEAVGTPRYMAPEQLRGEPVDERTDVYSLGAVLYEMATGVAAFARPAERRRAAGGVRQERPLSPHLAPVVRRCLAFDPDRRWSTAAVLATELERLAGEESDALVAAAG